MLHDSFEWGPEQERDAVQAALLFGAYNPTHPMVLEVSVVGKDAIWHLW